MRTMICTAEKSLPLCLSFLSIDLQLMRITTYHNNNNIVEYTFKARQTILLDEIIQL